MLIFKPKPYLFQVLIVAKCIVNFWNDGYRAWNFGVLIVAKCIVNVQNGIDNSPDFEY